MCPIREGCSNTTAAMPCALRRLIFLGCSTYPRLHTSGSSQFFRFSESILSILENGFSRINAKVSADSRTESSPSRVEDRCWQNVANALPKYPGAKVMCGTMARRVAPGVLVSVYG